MDEESLYSPLASSNIASASSDLVTARPPNYSRPDAKKIGVLDRDQTSPPSPSCSSSSYSNGLRRKKKKNQQQKQRKGVLVGSRHRRPPRGHGGGVQDLALPLGMSFAAVLSQEVDLNYYGMKFCNGLVSLKVLDGNNGSRIKLPVDRLSLVCTSAVKESISNIYGARFDTFLRNFENSFHSTLKTLCLINGTSMTAKGNRALHQDDQRHKLVNEMLFAEQENIAHSSFRSSSNFEAVEGNHDAPNATVEDNHEASSATVKEFQENLLTSTNNQLVLHGQINQELAQASHSFINPGFSQAIFSTFEKSVMEQTRSNDLKAFEIGLISRKLKLKESQLALNTYSHMLEKIKITMGISKATFKEEKLRNQMLDTRHAELLRRCIDLLVGGLFIMSGFLSYGAYVFSYERITEATTSCSAIPKESRSWWIPKQVASFNSAWMMLRCHVVALSRMLFGLLMIVAIAYAVFQRSVTCGPTMMPMTFILLLMGLLCGISGKLCVDTLGGSGFQWLLLWESFCLLHFFANVFPSALHYVLYGPISISKGEVKSGTILPYWLRRFVFYLILSFVYPAMSGLLPFASFGTWREHFVEKMYFRNIGAEIED